MTAKVTTNPSRPGKATLSLTGVTIRSCTLKGAPTGVSLTGIKVLNLPYGATISSAKGFPVTIAGSSATKPVGFKAGITIGSTPLTCEFTAAMVSAHASNTGNKVSLAKQKFTLDIGKSSGDCSAASSVTVSATYGPLRDTSVKHSPKVFIS